MSGYDCTLGAIRMKEACSEIANDMAAVPAECLRKEVRPLAEVAYPEAYDEFKRLGLALAIREDDQCTIPAAKDLWSIQKRSEAAAMLSRTARQAAGKSRTASHS